MGTNDFPGQSISNRRTTNQAGMNYVRNTNRSDIDHSIQVSLFLFAENITLCVGYHPDIPAINYVLRRYDKYQQSS